MSETQNDPVVIVSAARTPMAAFQGEFASLTAAQLGAAAIAAAVERAGVKPELIDEAIMGCVLPAGQGQAPARQAALGAGLPLSTGCTTINKMCGSGMRAAMFAHDMLLSGSAEVIVAGGMESMTNAPYLLPKARGGMRMGHAQVLDHMFLDGLEDAYEKGRLMGTFAEQCASSYEFSRESQDAFAIESLRRAQRANEDGSFKWEIAPVTVQGRKGDVVVERDEQPFKANIEKIPSLKPAFAKDGTVTAGNASGINDAAAAVVVMSEGRARELGSPVQARISSYAVCGVEPRTMGIGPVPAIRKALDRAGKSLDEVDVIELNEAFAAQSLAVLKDLGLEGDARVNPNGGAIALGHPIAASGAILVTKLLHEMEREDHKLGLVSLCIGGGQGIAMLFERD